MNYELRILALLLIGFLFINRSVSSQTIDRTKYLDQSIKTDSVNVPLDSGTYYFPLNAFSDSTTTKIKLLMDRWFSGMLLALKEPLLYNKVEKKESYRFTYLRTFRSPIALRIEKDSDKITLYIKESSGAGGYSPGELTISQIKQISINDWNKFLSLLNKLDFWHMAVTSPHRGFDGSEWILEGSTKQNYHFVDRWSPSKSDSFKTCCEYLLKLSNFNLKKEDIY